LHQRVGFNQVMVFAPLPLICALTPRQLLLLLLLAMLAVLGVGMVLEHSYGVLPCPMCWWQRYAHTAIATAAALGLITKQYKPMALVIVAAALAGLGIAGWQFAAQHGLLPWPPSCRGESAQALTAGADLLQAMATTKVVPCDKEIFKLLGLSLAGWNIPTMLFAAGASLRVLLK
jgi:disulfide bond formation protein DsbB